MRLIMEDFGTKQYQVVYHANNEAWYACRLSDNTTTKPESGADGFEEYCRLKALWRQKGHAHFNTRCARMRFYP